MLGELIGGGINLINGFMNRDAQADANAANLAQARENNATQAKYAQLNLDQQREFAQNGIRWKTQDAIAAGLHPLAALGAQVSSFAPISVGTSSADIKSSPLDLAPMGQNISRAISAGSTAPERTDKQAAAVQAIATTQALEKGSLENDLLRTNIALTRSQIGPPIPIPRPGPARSTSGFAVSDDDLKQKPEDHPGTNIVRPFGYPLRSNPFFNDGQQFEDRYGDSEIGSTLKFGINTIADHIYTGYGLLPSWDEVKTATRPARRFMGNTWRR